MYWAYVLCSIDSVVDEFCLNLHVSLKDFLLVSACIFVHVWNFKFFGRPFFCKLFGDRKQKAENQLSKTENEIPPNPIQWMSGTTNVLVWTSSQVDLSWRTWWGWGWRRGLRWWWHNRYDDDDTSRQGWLLVASSPAVVDYRGFLSSTVLTLSTIKTVPQFVSSGWLVSEWVWVRACLRE